MNTKIAFLILIAVSSASQITAITYEELQQQVQKEADDAIIAIKQQYDKELPKRLYIGASAAVLTAFCFMMTNYYRDTKNPISNWLLAPLTALGGFATACALIKINNDDQFTNQLILNQDRIYHEKMKRLHTRHTLTDIANLQLKRLQDLIKPIVNYFENTKQVLQNALPNDKNHA